MTAAVLGDLPGLDWRVHARCRGADPHLFHPNLHGRGVAGGPDLRGPAQVAWEWCQPCPVITQCHDLAERTRSTGIWAGCLRSQRGGRIDVPVDVIPLVPAAPKKETT